MSTLAAIRATPGLDAYLDELEVRLERAVRTHPGVVAAIGSEALAAGGKRLRPLLCFFAAPSDGEPPVAAAVAVELVHMATLVHDDLIDCAAVRRGRATAWSAHGEDAARAAGDYLFSRAFGELAASGDAEGSQILAIAALSLARGEALQRRQTHRADTPIGDYLERCALKTGKLFEAACLLGSRRAEIGAFGLALGVAFQIVDDILDCCGETIETGKIPGTDLREGTPTLPLLLAARDDEVVRRALEGGPLTGAIVRIGATGAFERSREVAREYADRALSCIGDHEHRLELAAIAEAVVDRNR
jgi:geranylgeranyl pyrophosphate synthase